MIYVGRFRDIPVIAIAVVIGLLLFGGVSAVWTPTDGTEWIGFVLLAGIFVVSFVAAKAIWSAVKNKEVSK